MVREAAKCQQAHMEWFGWDGVGGMAETSVPSLGSWAVRMGKRCNYIEGQEGLGKVFTF